MNMICLTKREILKQKIIIKTRKKQDNKFVKYLKFVEILNSRCAMPGIICGVLNTLSSNMIITEQIKMEMPIISDGIIESISLISIIGTASLITFDMEEYKSHWNNRELYNGRLAMLAFICLVLLQDPNYL